MRKYLLSLLLILSIGSIASAQQSGNYAGAGLGYPYIVSAHYGFADMLGNNLDLRVAGGMHMYTFSSFAVSGDVIYHFRNVDPVSAPYAGGGLTLAFGGGSALGVSYSGFMWNVHGLGGYQYRFDPSWSVFGELQLGYSSWSVGSSIYSFSGLSAGTRIGVNYYF